MKRINLSLSALQLTLSVLRASKRWISAFVLTVCSTYALSDSLVYDNQVDTCTTTNCGSQEYTGIFSKPQIVAGGEQQIIPWSMEVYGTTNECVRVDMVWLNSASIPPGGPQMNPEMVVVSNVGAVYTSKDSNAAACPTCPRISFQPATPGYHRVIVTSENTTFNASAFRVRYGRYALSNPNCSGLTPAVAN